MMEKREKEIDSLELEQPKDSKGKGDFKRKIR